MKIFSISFLAIIAFAASATARFTTREEEDVEVDISPKCAAVLLSGGALGGVGLAYAVTPAALCTAGFCPAGVSGASFASWWQSTMPLVVSGSLFTTFQSVAMGGMGTKAVVTASMIGGAWSARYLEDLCAYVDDPASNMAPVFDGTLVAVRGAYVAAEKAKTTCSSSESCTATMEFAQVASATVSSSISSMWNYISDGVSQTAEAYNNALIRMYEEKIPEIEEEIKDLRKNIPTAEVLESISTLEEELDRSYARLSRLKQR
mmetsp:Transcript_11810/g.22404  ORF Transcript_11810/g.22404 Transcript_11810/m.22404 type:complete len:262 (-) Transcript_11810:3071-3856(-)|eukprot:CAMPEP_0201622054 /NCGR_PEP_ID=MMETSP0492-20130828/47205_1 /ASSEMBLY_ACC=CAM_ASM_000837 /TAXON_ID=420259 /ORGANISM="Thalassiosira gravida, Strain GMp14c1" /LENGTH=261 /DNA_ID=CAMNT_0048091627 /DNA_START=463 /DNA_END=1248 /DNA_ORIENTATION=+